MFDPTKPVQTRDGRPARIVATLAGCPEYPHLAVITDEDGSEYSESYSPNGRVYTHAEREDDLVNVQERTVRYFAIGADDKGAHGRFGAPTDVLDVVVRSEGSWGPKVLKMTYEEGVPVKAEIA